VAAEGKAVTTIRERQRERRKILETQGPFEDLQGEKVFEGRGSRNPYRDRDETR
jgi:hypothetical protein